MSIEIDPIILLKGLIKCRSVTPDDAGCQQLITSALQSSNPEIHHIDFNETSNLCMSWGSGSPHLLLLGHTDVVPAGPLDSWDTDPFSPEERDGMIFGRGAADMKSSVAAMVSAIERTTPLSSGQGRLSLLMTSDEEGDATDGVQRAIPELIEHYGDIDYCLVGEPSSIEQLGDLIRIGRRGSLTGYLNIPGIQGHAAYPDLADNPIHHALPAFVELAGIQWDQGSDQFPPTSFQITNFISGTGASNVIPGNAELCFNFRFSTCQTADGIKQKVQRIMDKHQVKGEIDWRQPSLPFFSQPGALRDAVIEAIDYTCGIQPTCDTGGGTSDGRFIAPLGVEVIELGPINASIHQTNECVLVADVTRLTDLYTQVIEKLLKHT